MPGSGIIGQLIGALCKKAGTSYVAMFRVGEFKVKKSRKLGSFDEYSDTFVPDRQEQFSRASRGGFDIVFECVGGEASLDACLDVVRRGGCIVI